MKTTLAVTAVIAILLAGCTTVTSPDGTTVTNISPLGTDLILRAAEVAEAKILDEK